MNIPVFFYHYFTIFSDLYLYCFNKKFEREVNWTDPKLIGGGSKNSSLGNYQTIKNNR